MEADLVKPAQQASESRRAWRCRYNDKVQRGYGLAWVLEVKAAWDSHRTARFLKCSDYVTDLEMYKNSCSNALRTPAGTSTITEDVDYIAGIPYYDCYHYLFAVCRIMLEPIGGVTVLIPKGDPDPAMIPVPFGVITGLFVNPEYRRLGYGQRLLREALDFIKKEELKRAVLRIDDGAENQTAISLYTKEGFSRDKDQQGYVMVKDLE